MFAAVERELLNAQQNFAIDMAKKDKKIVELRRKVRELEVERDKLMIETETMIQESVDVAMKYEILEKQMKKETRRANEAEKHCKELQEKMQEIVDTSQERYLEECNRRETMEKEQQELSKQLESMHQMVDAYHQQLQSYRMSGPVCGVDCKHRSNLEAMMMENIRLTRIVENGMDYLAEINGFQQRQLDTLRTVWQFKNNPYNSNLNLKYYDESLEDLQYRIDRLTARGIRFRFGDQVLTGMKILPVRAGDVNGTDDKSLSNNLYIPKETPLVLWYGIQIPFIWIEALSPV